MSSVKAEKSGRILFGVRGKGIWRVESGYDGIYELVDSKNYKGSSLVDSSPISFRGQVEDYLT